MGESIEGIGLLFAHFGKSQTDIGLRRTVPVSLDWVGPSEEGLTLGPHGHQPPFRVSYVVGSPAAFNSDVVQTAVS